MSLLEIACFNPSSALLAASSGANRIELCANKPTGGISPPVAWLDQIKPSVQIPIYIMIRPRSGNFIYSPQEFSQMKSQIALFKSHEADGFVIGIVTEEGEVDVVRTVELVKLAGPLPCTFHRTFDQVADKQKALEDVIASGCKAVLTSGGEGDAVEGVGVLLRSLVEQGQGRDFTVIVGGGVRSGNLASLRKQSGAVAFHSSAVIDQGELADADEVRKLGEIMASCRS